MENNAGITPNRFRNDPAFQHGLEAGGRLLVQGALVVERYGRSVSEASFGAGVDADFVSELEDALEQWAKSDGCWFSNPKQYYKDCHYRFYGYGGEAQVFAEEDRFVHKICRVGQFANLRLFFDRIIIQNSLCPAAALEVEGFGRDEFCNFVVLLKQHFFREARTMTESEVSLFMRCMGFRELVTEPYHVVRYFSESVIAEDLHPGNIWMTAEGNVVIIDGIFSFNE